MQESGLCGLVDGMIIQQTLGLNVLTLKVADLELLPRTCDCGGLFNLPKTEFPFSQVKWEQICLTLTERVRWRMIGDEKVAQHQACSGCSVNVHWTLNRGRQVKLSCHHQ